jgi:diacylglycerol kinase (ATP)
MRSGRGEKALRVLVIANPAAGRGRGGGWAARLVSALEARGHAVELHATRGPEDARERVRAREGAVERIVTAGGDGTLNDVLNGLADPGATPLLPIPLGTANMLARCLRVPREVERLAALLAGGRVRRLDLGLAHFGGAAPVRFLSVAGVGFDAMVTETIGRRRKGRLGYRGYVAPILRTVARYRAPRLAVSLDGEPPISCGLALLGKVPRYGGVLRVTPRAAPDDGLLHTCVIRRAAAGGLLRLVPAAFAGRLDRSSRVVLRTASRIDVTADEAVPVQLDGDHWGATPVTFTLKAGVVPVVAPELR